MHDFGGAVSKLYKNSSEIQENSNFSELKVISELESRLVSGSVVLHTLNYVVSL